MGLLSGSIAGIETDENGNIVGFSPEKFAMGFLGGAGGSLAVKKGLEIKARSVAKNYSNIAKDNPMLLNEIVKRDLSHYARTSAANSLTRFLNKHKELDLNPQIFAGEKALVNEAYKPQAKKLKEAKKLESSGASEIEIWESTGWYKDKDKKWKFEISQKGGELLTKDTFGRAYKKEYLPTILQDDELFNAYPDLKYIRVIEDKGLGAGVCAAYSTDTKTIYIKNLQAKNAKFGLYHELQHAVQDIEGFGFGYKNRASSDESFNQYYKQHGEAEARNVERRLDTDNKQKIKAHRDGIAFNKREIDFWEGKKDKPEYNHNNEANNKIQEAQENIALNREKIKELQGIAKLGRYTQHPHKTMDIDVKDTIAEATIHREALSRELESGFLDSSGRVDYEKIKQYAEPMPKPQSEQEFTTNLLRSPNATPNKANNRVKYKTPAGEVNIYLPYAYRHFSKGGKWGNGKENRGNLTGALQQVLDTPAFVTKDKQETRYFYKPFINERGITNIVSVSIAKNGKLDYKTSYEATRGRLMQMITEHDLVYMQDIAT